ncbi:MAG: EamA family transporter [Actinomycetia bacterium]|nr:EamA family transporter [Actinomycetes bacterium]
MTLRTRTWTVALALATVWLLWGSTFLGIRVVVQSAPALLSAGVRFLVAGALLLVALRIWRRIGPAEGVRCALRGRVAWLVVLGLLHFTVANGLVSLAVRDLPSSTAGVLFSTVPLWSLVATTAIRGSLPSRADVLATLTGILGVVVLLGFTTAGLLPSVLVLVAAGTWAAATLLAGHDPRASPPSRLPVGAALASSVQMIGGGIGLIIASGVAGEWVSLDPTSIGWSAWLAQGYLIVFGSLLGFVAYTWLVVSGVDPRLTSTFSYVSPLVAVALGALILAEPVGPRTLIGTALVVAAVAWTVLAALLRHAGRPATELPHRTAVSTVANPGSSA